MSVEPLRSANAERLLRNVAASKQADHVARLILTPASSEAHLAHLASFLFVGGWESYSLHL